MPPWALISPASRGIGLALARRVLQTTNVPVVATARTTGNIDRTKELILKDLNVDDARLTVLAVDVLDESTIQSAAQKCKATFSPDTHHLHLSFILPGILFPEKSPTLISSQDALLTFQTNTLGPLLLMKHFSPFLPKKSTEMPPPPPPPPLSPSDSEPAGPPTSRSSHRGLPQQATWSTLSARVGSITDNHLGGWYSYRASKAAVNQLTRTFDQHLRSSAGDRAMAIALHPGTVRTELSRPFWPNVRREKLFEADWVAGRLVGLVTGEGLDRREGLDEGEVRPLTLEARGRCWDWAGKEVPP